MTHSNWYLLCFVFGFVWSIAAVLLGSFHVHGHVHAGAHDHGFHVTKGSGHSSADSKLWGDLLNVNSVAIFLAWFGGCGYLMSRHSGWAIVAVLFISALAGLAASFVLVALLRFLHGKEIVMDPDDYEMVGVLGQVASAIRAGGTGEILFRRDGGRTSACARSDDGQPIERGVEVVVTRYEKGIAYVRTWDAMTDQPSALASSEHSGGGGEEAPRL
jgi:membrane protein implicated in regulation of membrane protease activity